MDKTAYDIGIVDCNIASDDNIELLPNLTIWLIITWLFDVSRPGLSPCDSEKLTQIKKVTAAAACLSTLGHYTVQCITNGSH